MQDFSAALREITEAAQNGFITLTFAQPIGKVDIKKITVKRYGAGYQAAIYSGTQVKHENFDNTGSLAARLLELWNMGFKSCDITAENQTVHILRNKTGQCTIKRVQVKQATKTATDEHNRRKNYIISDGEPADFLVELGVMTETGIVKNDYQKKFRQINRFLEFIADVADSLPDNAQIVDFGCGKSYLTFALYYYFNQVCHKNVKIVGLDLKKDVIERCSKLADKLGYSNLEFINGDIEQFESNFNWDMVVTLHACDTATDFALHKAVSRNARVILSVPCCQHELNPQIENAALSPLLKHGILRERFAALLTDAIRAQVLTDLGYKTTVMEFIDMEHTAKNILIRAIKTHAPRTTPSEETLRLMREYGVRQKLFDLVF